MTGEARLRLEGFLDSWFGILSDPNRSPSDVVAPLLTFNRPVARTFDGDVEVLVAEQQGVWLWGRTLDGRYVERRNEAGLPWRRRWQRSATR